MLESNTRFFASDMKFVTQNLFLFIDIFVQLFAAFDKHHIKYDAIFLNHITFIFVRDHCVLTQFSIYEKSILSNLRSKNRSYID